MSIDVYRELFVVYTSLLLFYIVNFIYTSIRNFSWILNGTYWRLLQNQKPENYEQSAQVLNILFEHHLDQFLEPLTRDYILTHERFEHPEFVLRDDVTLLNITETEAIFVQNRKGAEHPYKHNFFILGQFASTEKIIILPINQFNRLAESVNHDGAKIIFLQNQSRCGGTLLTNIFLESGRCITFNEPGVVNMLSKFIIMNPKTFDKETEKRIFRNAIYMLCKPYRGLGNSPLAYVVKPTVTAVGLIPYVEEYMPEAKQLFLYREPVHVATSLRRLAEALPSLKFIYYTPIIPGSTALLLRSIGHTNNDFRGWEPRYKKDLELGFRMVCSSMYHYCKGRDLGIAITGIRYRDLVDHPHSIISQMFKLCEIPGELVPIAANALKRDSQERAPFSQEKLKRMNPNPPRVDNGFLEAARDMAKSFNVKGPDDWQKSFRLEGSLIPQ